MLEGVGGGIPRDAPRMRSQPEMLWVPGERRGRRAHRGGSSKALLGKTCFCQINSLVCWQGPGPLQYDREARSEPQLPLLAGLVLLGQVGRFLSMDG